MEAALLESTGAGSCGRSMLMCYGMTLTDFDGQDLGIDFQPWFQQNPPPTSVVEAGQYEQHPASEFYKQWTNTPPSTTYSSNNRRNQRLQATFVQSQNITPRVTTFHPANHYPIITSCLRCWLVAFILTFAGAHIAGVLKNDVPSLSLAELQCLAISLQISLVIRHPSIKTPFNSLTILWWK